jgi:hypothetical protein
MTGINDCSRPLNLTGRAEPVEQEPMQLLPHTGALPLSRRRQQVTPEP